MRHGVLHCAVGEFGQHAVVEEHGIYLVAVQTMTHCGQLVVRTDMEDFWLHC